MKTLLNNGFRAFKKYAINWYSKQRAFDWICYASFLIGVIFYYCSPVFLQSSITPWWCQYIIFPIYAGAVFEFIFIIIYIIKKVLIG